MATNAEERWIAEHLDVLEPTWTATAERAQGRLDNARRAKSIAFRTLVAATLAAACLVVVLMPETRALAQQVWAQWTVSRLAVVRINLPGDWHITMNGAVKRAATPQDVFELAGYQPILPVPRVAGAEPELSVLSPLTLTQTIDAASLRATLQRIGATDVEVPAAWQNAELGAHVGPTVVAEYADGSSVTQTKPFLLYVPVGMALNDVANAIFRSAGVPPAEAKAMALAYAIQPAWFLGVGKDEPVRVEQTVLGAGPAVVMETLDAAAARSTERATVLLNTPERLFMVVAPTRERAVALAESLR